MLNGDVSQAFANGEAYERHRYMVPPKPACNSWDHGPGVWWRVKGPLYGYKDSP